MTQEMTRYILPVLLVSFLVTVSNCQKILQSNMKNEQVITLSFSKENGTLKVRSGGEICLLADDAIDYDTFVSPNATLIAVETLMMSNLQIIRVYKKDAKGCFQPLKNKLATKLWNDLSVKEGFSMDNINYPRMKFLKWIDNNQVSIALSGEIDNKVIDANVSCILISQDNKTENNATLSRTK